MDAPFTVITAQPDLPAKPRPLWQRLIVGTLLACTLLVQTGQVLAQYQNYGQTYGPNSAQNNGQPTTGNTPPSTGALSGYTKDGTLFMGGQKIGNPHQILHDAQIPSFLSITANRYTYTNDPTHGQGTLAQMETATTVGSDASVLLNRLYLSPTNPYVQGAPGPYPNYQTYQGVLLNSQQAGYLLTNADDGKTYAFKTLTAASRQAVDLLIRELPNTSQFKAAADPLGGGVGVRVTQNGDAAALAAYLATVKPYDYSWQPNFGNTFGTGFGQIGQNPYAGWANSGNIPGTVNDYGNFDGANGQINNQQNFELFVKQLQDSALANDKQVRSQTAANSLELNGVNPNSLFGEGYNLFQYGSNSNPNRDLENDFLKRLQSGQLTVGSADYLEAQRIAYERYRIAYAVRLETNKPLQYSVADAQRKANELNLAAVNPNELFGQGFDLFQFNKALRANGDAENVLLARLQNGELTPGSADYLQATQIAQERLRVAYSQSLSPPPPKVVPKWKLIAAVVVGAVLTFITAGAAAPLLGAALGLASTSLVVTSIAGIVGSYVGAVVSTGITTGSMSKALRAGEKALVSGSVKAIVANAIGAGFIGDIIGGAVATQVVNGGSFEDALKGAIISAAVTGIADGIGKEFAGVIKDANLGDIGTELAHGALGCVTGAIRAKGAEGCAAGAAGAIAGHLIAPVIFGTGFDPLGTGTVQGVKDSAVFFSGVVGGAVAATVGKDDQVNTNFGIGSAAGGNAAENNALSATLNSGIRVCMKSATCLTAIGGELGAKALSASVIAYMAANPGVTQSGAEAVVISQVIASGVVNGVYKLIAAATGGSITETPVEPPKLSGTPPFPVTPDTLPNNTANPNPVTTGGSNNTEGNQIVNPVGSNVGGSGYGAGGTPNMGNGIVMSTVPPSILDGNGQLPPVTGVNGGAIERPATPAPNQTAEQFAKDAFNGQTPISTTPIKTGGWVAKLPDGTFVTYRPAGEASNKTSGTTATVEVNSPSVKAINKGDPAKFKFPKL